MTMIPQIGPVAPKFSSQPSFPIASDAPDLVQRPFNSPSLRASAIVYCEANFAEIDGKTANGLVRNSEKFDIVAVIDSTKAGLDSGTVLDGEPNGIPIFRDLISALNAFGSVPSTFIYGMAPAIGMLSVEERKIVLAAIECGMQVVNGLHEFLTADPEFVKAAKAANVTILDVRKPRAKNDLRLFSGRINAVSAPRIAVLGTACTIGKRTTASILTRALIARGVTPSWSPPARPA